MNITNHLLKILWVILIFVTINSNIVIAQPVEKITSTFTRKVERNSSTELIQGTIYLNLNGSIHIRVYEPVDQWMVIDNNTMIIYYPKEKKAFRFFRKNPFTLPFYQSFFTLNNKDIDLSKLGFILINNQMRKDTLISSWRQSNKTLSDDIVRISLVNDRIECIDIIDKDDTILSKTKYSNYIRKGNRSFPLEILSIQNYNGLNIKEKINYTDPKINIPFPKEVQDFNIPTSTIIKDIQW